MSKFHAIYGKGGVSPKPDGGTYGEVQTLLWENTTPTSEFANKKININLTNYDGIIVEFIDGGQLIRTRCKVAFTDSNFLGAGYASVEIDNSLSRNVTLARDGVTFSNGLNNASSNKLVVIPYKIYGYKQYETGSITGEARSVSFSTNTDLQLDKNSYYLITAVNNTAIVASKGTIITKIDSTTIPSSDYYGQSVIIFTGKTGIVNFNMAGKAKKLSVGD